MEHPSDESSPPGDDGGRRRRRGIVAAGVAAGLTLGGLGVAAAQTESPPTTAAPAPAAPDAEGPRGGPGKGRHGPGMGIHGEFTTRAPGSGYQTMASQVGEVTAVSDSSITVKSEDEFTREYSVNDDTMVNAGNDGIGDVKQGDEVRVLAVVKDGKAAAVNVRDGTQARALRDKWAPPRPEGD